MAPPSCAHTHLATGPSSHATNAGYSRPNPEKRAAAATTSGRISRLHLHDVEKINLYPAPVILPGDDLALDPTYPAQSLRAWDRCKDRNPVTSDRGVIYLATPPDISEAIFMQPWCEVENSVPTPSLEDVQQYLQAFYHGLRVEILKPELRFVAWEQNASKSRKARSKVASIPYIGLANGEECTRIRVRHGSENQDSAFSHQLNLNDLIDGIIEALPRDAYALVMLLQHDLYEDEEDAFVCGRAYGGSRVAVVSMARYNPALDDIQDIDKSHPWPLSHCQVFVDEQCAKTTETSLEEPGRPRKKAKSLSMLTKPDQSVLNALSSAAPVSNPISSAVIAFLSLPEPKTLKDLSDLWLSRVVRTVSHELGHCFAIDHCIYNAWVMQGSASLNEDTRQPPYLCPIDLAKVLKATGTEEGEHDQALLQYCEKHGDVQMFRALGGWIKWKLTRTYGGEQE